MTSTSTSQTVGGYGTQPSITFRALDKQFVQHPSVLGFVENQRSLTPPLRPPPHLRNLEERRNSVQVINYRHSDESPVEAVRRREVRRAVMSSPMYDLSTDDEEKLASITDSADYRESGLKKLKSKSWESIARWEKENEFLFTLIEDECDWLRKLFPDETVSAATFFKDIEDGVLLCKLAQLCQNYAEDFAKGNNTRVAMFPIYIHPRKKCQGRLGKFMRRENVELFLKWCRVHGIPEPLLFESNDVVEQTELDGVRENAREIVLCLMEVARLGVKFGLEPPQLILLEKEIELEEQMDSSVDGSISPTSVDSGVDTMDLFQYGSMDVPSSNNDDSSYGRDVIDHAAYCGDKNNEDSLKNNIPIVINDSHNNRDNRTLTKQKNRTTKNKHRNQRKKSEFSKTELHDKVTSIIESYKILKITRLKEGKYLILGKVMFVRLLNDHCLVRIGGGWDTLEHYLITHINNKIAPDTFDTDTSSLVHHQESINVPISQTRYRKNSGFAKKSFLTKSTPNLLGIDDDSDGESSSDFSSKDTSTLTKKRFTKDKISQAILRVQENVVGIKRAASLDWTHLTDHELKLRTSPSFSSISKGQFKHLTKMADAAIGSSITEHTTEENVTLGALADSETEISAPDTPKDDDTPDVTVITKNDNKEDDKREDKGVKTRKHTYTKITPKTNKTTTATKTSSTRKELPGSKSTKTSTTNTKSNKPLVNGTNRVAGSRLTSSSTRSSTTATRTSTTATRTSTTAARNSTTATRTSTSTRPITSTARTTSRTTSSTKPSSAKTIATKETRPLGTSNRTKSTTTTTTKSSTSSISKNSNVTNKTTTSTGKSGVATTSSETTLSRTKPVKPPSSVGKSGSSMQRPTRTVTASAKTKVSKLTTTSKPQESLNKKPATKSVTNSTLSSAAKKTRPTSSTSRSVSATSSVKSSTKTTSTTKTKPSTAPSKTKPISAPKKVTSKNASSDSKTKTNNKTKSEKSANVKPSQDSEAKPESVISQGDKESISNPPTVVPTAESFDTANENVGRLSTSPVLGESEDNKPMEIETIENTSSTPDAVTENVKENISVGHIIPDETSVNDGDVLVVSNDVQMPNDNVTLDQQRAEKINDLSDNNEYNTVDLNNKDSVFDTDDTNEENLTSIESSTFTLIQHDEVKEYDSDENVEYHAETQPPPINSASTANQIHQSTYRDIISQQIGGNTMVDSDVDLYCVTPLVSGHFDDADVNETPQLASPPLGSPVKTSTEQLSSVSMVTPGEEIEDGAMEVDQSDENISKDSPANETPSVYDSTSVDVDNDAAGDFNEATNQATDVTITTTNVEDIHSSNDYIIEAKVDLESNVDENATPVPGDCTPSENESGQLPSSEIESVHSDFVPEGGDEHKQNNNEISLQDDGLAHSHEATQGDVQLVESTASEDVPAIEKESDNDIIQSDDGFACSHEECQGDVLLVESTISDDLGSLEQESGNDDFQFDATMENTDSGRVTPLPTLVTSATPIVDIDDGYTSHHDSPVKEKLPSDEHVFTENLYSQEHQLNYNAKVEYFEEDASSVDVVVESDVVLSTENEPLESFPSDSNLENEKNLGLNDESTEQTSLEHHQESPADQEETTADQEEITADQDEEITADQDEPTADQDEPTADQDGPTAYQDGPTADQDGPTAYQDGPIADQDEPTAIQDEPTAIQDEPTSIQDEPTADQYEPTENLHKTSIVEDLEQSPIEDLEKSPDKEDLDEPSVEYLEESPVRDVQQESTRQSIEAWRMEEHEVQQSPPSPSPPEDNEDLYAPESHDNNVHQETESAFFVRREESTSIGQDVSFQYKQVLVEQTTSKTTSFESNLRQVNDVDVSSSDTDGVSESSESPNHHIVYSDKVVMGDDMQADDETTQENEMDELVAVETPPLTTDTYEPMTSRQAGDDDYV